MGFPRPLQDDGDPLRARKGEAAARVVTDGVTGHSSKRGGSTESQGASINAGTAFPQVRLADEADRMTDVAA